MDNCVISAVGARSLHREWLKGTHCNFDLHLIIYDDSLDIFGGDASNICHKVGYKLKVVYEYLMENLWLLTKYKYFFIPDDDILMDAHTVNLMFAAMEVYHLQIAQPALVRSYYLWEHTLKDPYSRLRYTNYVEMMVPCFSNMALQKVLFTFGENETGWGVETHWALLIDADCRDMAIIDDVEVVHTRPIQSGQLKHRQEAAAYLRKYGLVTNVVEYGYIAIEEGYVPQFLCDRETYWRLIGQLKGMVSKVFCSQNDSLDDYVAYICFLYMIGDMSQSKVYHDMARTMFMQTFGLQKSIRQEEILMFLKKWFQKQKNKWKLESQLIIQAYDLWKLFTLRKKTEICLWLREIFRRCDASVLSFSDRLILTYMLYYNKIDKTVRPMGN